LPTGHDEDTAFDDTEAQRLGRKVGLAPAKTIAPELRADIQASGE
jgi:hypothetical protein